ncbi:hypothetical protein B0H16DRAFT_1693884 [Mycena metata]|uniref:Uncharacterized protein n=1 Tax=Mycena metata TaxID=1033252 RepID=A0AAD7II01_9AGAR|nr:hypothetical protein B0H16DRAFT_1693884 [Mycena metata]
MTPPHTDTLKPCRLARAAGGHRGQLLCVGCQYYAPPPQSTTAFAAARALSSTSATTSTSSSTPTTVDAAEDSPSLLDPSLLLRARRAREHGAGGGEDVRDDLLLVIGAERAHFVFHSSNSYLHSGGAAAAATSSGVSGGAREQENLGKGDPDCPAAHGVPTLEWEGRRVLYTCVLFLKAFVRRARVWLGAVEESRLSLRDVSFRRSHSAASSVALRVGILAVRARRVTFGARCDMIRACFGLVCGSGGSVPLVWAVSRAAAAVAPRVCVASGLGLELKSVLRLLLCALRASGWWTIRRRFARAGDDGRGRDISSSRKLHVGLGGACACGRRRSRSVAILALHYIHRNLATPAQPGSEFWWGGRGGGEEGARAFVRQRFGCTLPALALWRHTTAVSASAWLALSPDFGRVRVLQQHYTNATWATVSVIPLAQCNSMERECLEKANETNSIFPQSRLLVSQKTYEGWGRLLKGLVGARARAAERHTCHRGDRLHPHAHPAFSHHHRDSTTHRLTQGPQTREREREREQPREQQRRRMSLSPSRSISVRREDEGMEVDSHHAAHAYDRREWDHKGSRGWKGWRRKGNARGKNPGRQRGGKGGRGRLKCAWVAERARTASYHSGELSYSSDDNRDAEMADVEGDDWAGEDDDHDSGRSDDGRAGAGGLGMGMGKYATTMRTLGTRVRRRTRRQAGTTPLTHHQLPAPQLAPAHQFLPSSSSTSQLQQYSFGMSDAGAELQRADAALAALPRLSQSHSHTQHDAHNGGAEQWTPPRAQGMQQWTPPRMGHGATTTEYGGSEWTPPRVVLPRFADSERCGAGADTDETHPHQPRRAVFANAGPPGGKQSSNRDVVEAEFDGIISGLVGNYVIRVEFCFK